MTTRSRLRLLFTAVLSALLSVALVAPAEAQPRHTFPDRIELPDNFLPEGITIGKAPVAYLGSRADGDIIAADLRTGQRRAGQRGSRPRIPLDRTQDRQAGPAVRRRRPDRHSPRGRLPHRGSSG